MGLYPQADQGIPTDTAALGRILLAEDSPYRMVGDQWGELISEQDFADLYANTGGPALSPVFLSLVTVFQMMENLPDRQAAEAVLVRIDWKYALHLRLEHKGFCFTNLSHFRARLLAHEAEYRVFDRFVERLVELGWIRRRGRQRSDSTHILAGVARLSRLELVWETLRTALQALQQADPSWVSTHIPTAFCSAYLVRRHDYNLSQAEVAQELALAGQDGRWLLEQVTVHWPQAFAQLEAVETLRQVWQQQFEPEEHAHPGQPRQKVDGSGLIQSPHDPEARYSEKRGQGWQGYKGQVSETAEDKGTPNFIDDIDVTDAQLADVQSLPAIQQRLRDRLGPPSDQYVDQSYVSTERLAESQRQGTRLVGPVASPPQTGLFTAQNFELDLPNRQALCPAGRLAQYASLSQRADGSREFVFFFGRQCLTCPLRTQCTTAKEGRTLRYHVDHAFLEQRHREMKTADFWRDMQHRPPVEATISQLVRLGARRCRYRGLRKTRFQWIFTAVAANLRRWSLALSRGLAPCWQCA